MTFLSTYPVRGTTELQTVLGGSGNISIHVPRAGYDWGKSHKGTKQTHFYPRTPCGVRRVTHYHREPLPRFLSTYPVRGTTPIDKLNENDVVISIHVPRAGYDLSECGIYGEILAFLSTYPVRGTTYEAQRLRCVLTIFLSTYPVRGTTPVMLAMLGVISHFYPRTPCGVRPAEMVGAATMEQVFLSTYPVRGTTSSSRKFLSLGGISIHVPRAGYDHQPGTSFCWYKNFYPRTPCGVRPRGWAGYRTV